MENNNNYNLILDYPPNHNSDNHLNHNNGNRYNNNSHIKKITIYFILTASFFFLFLNFFSLYYSYNYISYNLSNNNNDPYSICIQNQTISEMFFTFLATLASISVIILSFGFLINKDLFMEKFLESQTYYNYFIFGPFLLCTSFLGFINYNKIGYSCEKIPDNKSINLNMLFCLLIILIFGAVITCGYSTIYMFRYMTDSIKFKNNGNYFLGKAFWKFALSRNRNRRRFFHERND